MTKIFIELFFLSTVIFFLLFLPFSLHMHSDVVNAGDPLFYAWNLQHNIDSLRHGFKDMLDTNIFYPETNTLAYSDTLFVQSVLVAPILLLTNNTVLTENFYLWLTFPLTAIGMFLLCYHLTHYRLGSIIAALFFTFSYPRLAQISHVPALSTQWLPFWLLFFLQFWQQGKCKYLLLSMLFFLLLLTSSIYYGVFVALFGSMIAIIFTGYFLVNQRQVLLDRIKKLLIIIIPFLVVIAVISYPYIRFRVENPAITRSLDESRRNAAVLPDYISVLPTSMLKAVGLPMRTDEHALFPTITVLFLAGIGIWKYREKRTTTFLLLLCILSFLLSLPGPYYFAYYLFPFLQITRVPARFGIFFIFFLSTLAAYGLSAISLWRLNKKVLFGSVVIFFLAEIWQIGTPSVLVPSVYNFPRVYQWLILQPEQTVIVELPLTPLYWGNPIPIQIAKRYEQLTVEDMLASEAYRVYFSSFHKKRILNGYSGFFPQTYYDAAFRLASFPSEDSLRLLESRRVTYVIVHWWQYDGITRQALHRLVNSNEKLKLVKSFGDDEVYRL